MNSSPAQPHLFPTCWSKHILLSVILVMLIAICSPGESDSDIEMLEGDVSQDTALIATTYQEPIPPPAVPITLPLPLETLVPRPSTPPALSKPYRKASECSPVATQSSSKRRRLSVEPTSSPSAPQLKPTNPPNTANIIADGWNFLRLGGVPQKPKKNVQPQVKSETTSFSGNKKQRPAGTGKTALYHQKIKDDPPDTSKIFWLDKKARALDPNAKADNDGRGVFCPKCSKHVCLKQRYQFGRFEEHFKTLCKGDGKEQPSLEKSLTSLVNKDSVSARRPPLPRINGEGRQAYSKLGGT